ncbi:MAG: HAMP domain-containing protein [Nitrospinae bacterium]|nr:HAMP domain-containing protein [Nitrospinota bacterium]
MSVKSRVLLILAAIFVGLLLFLSATSRFLLQPAFEMIERRDVQHHLEQAISHMHNEMLVMKRSLNDWSTWDDTYRFSATGNKRYVSANFLPETFVALDLNFIVVLDRHGKTLYAGGYDLDAQREVTVPPSLLAEMARSGSPINRLNDFSNQGIAGIVSMPDGALVIAARPILKNNGIGPVNGTFLWGRYLNDIAIYRMEHMIKMPVAVRWYFDKALPPDFLQARLKSANGEPFPVVPTAAGYLGAYGVLNDVYGKPAFIFRTEAPKSITNQGKLTIDYFLILFTAVAGTFIAVTMALLNRQILSPLSALSKSVRNLSLEGGAPVGVPVRGSREIAALAESVNAMLAKIGEETKRRRDTEKGLLRQEKMASLGTLSAGVTHEILNPLNIIGTDVQLMQMDRHPPEVMERLDAIMRQIQRATKIVNALRVFAHPHKPENRLVDLHGLTDRTLLLLEHDLQLDNIMIERNFAFGVPLVWADEDKLAQVFLNILNNARDALRGRPDGKVTITTNATAGKVSVSFADNGPGIPPDMIAKVFDPFFTTKEPGKGTGLGLSIASSLIEEMGGKMTVGGACGSGAVFMLELPAGVPRDGGKDPGKPGVT